MIFLSNLGGLNFRLAQNRKRLRFQPDISKDLPIETGCDFVTELNDKSDFFNNFLKNNSDYLKSNKKGKFKKLKK